MELELIVLISGGLVAGITQLIKPYFVVSPLIVAAVLSIAGGLLFGALNQAGHWDAVSNFATVSFTGAVAVYQVLKQALNR